jgi:DNA-binding LacI/PurR family transcriptional regulator
MQALPTLEDVARRAETAVATAGRALGGYGKVAPVTRDRIFGASPLAQLLRERSGAA